MSIEIFKNFDFLANFDFMHKLIIYCLCNINKVMVFYGKIARYRWDIDIYTLYTEKLNFKK